jgi:bis(5'-adenosyl)-triphosphatase
MPPPVPNPIHFGTHLVTSQVFHLTPLSYALTNIRPILPGHVLICPIRPVPRLRDLSPPECADLFNTARTVSRMLERVLGATAFNVAVQDGVDAGQSVPHVHCHVIPRVKGDMGQVDEVYHRMDGPEGDIGQGLREREARGRQTFPEIEDADRRDRSLEDMVKEADWFRREMQADLARDSTSS